MANEDDYGPGLTHAMDLFDRLAADTALGGKIRRAALDATTKIESIRGWMRAGARAKMKEALKPPAETTKKK